MKRGRLYFFVSAALAFATCNVAVATTAEELAEIVRERDAAQAKRDIAQAEAEERKAKLGSINVENLPKGTGEATGLNVEAKILAYMAIDRIADRIAQDIRGCQTCDPKTVVFYSERELNSVLQFRAHQEHVSLLERQMTEAAGGDINSPKLPALATDFAQCPSDLAGAGPGLIINTALQVLSLFKTDKKITGTDVEVSEFALAMSLMKKLSAPPNGWTVVYPASYLPNVFTDPSKEPLSASETVAGFGRLISGRKALDALQKQLVEKREDIKKKIAEGKPTSPACVKQRPLDISTLDELEKRIKSVQAQIDFLVSSFLKGDEKTGAPALYALVTAEKLAKRLTGGYVLQIKPVAAGGATLAKTNLFTTNFYFSGGAIVSYLLFDGSTGRVVLSDTLPCYQGFIHADKLVTKKAAGAC